MLAVGCLRGIVGNEVLHPTDLVGALLWLIRARRCIVDDSLAPKNFKVVGRGPIGPSRLLAASGVPHLLSFEDPLSLFFLNDYERMPPV